jgi:predicted small lipoprotein YifL
MRIRRLIAALTMLALAASVAACNRKGEEYLDIGADEQLNARILQLQQTKTSAPLKDLTDFEWDAVFTYYEGVNPKRINSDIGVTVFKEGYSLMLNETLAVFTLDGKPVLALGLLPITFDVGRHSADVVLERGFELVEPQPADATATATATSPGPSPT